ncbi:MAG: hypothetical protein M3Z37_11685, partial [Candidatus Eremiobacteraeota bacterium]|nr:hypothetical protein [Candidatus Eremiobacteraeota bacterium]
MVALLCASTLCLGGCAQSLTHWMVGVRSAQGDQALTRLNLKDAETEYALALALDPKNAHARTGLGKVLYLRAKEDFINSKLDDAEVAAQRALRYAPGDAATLALSNEIEAAKIRREIVISNYPLYGAIGSRLRPAFKSVTTTNAEIQKQLKAFASDYDTAHLTRAIILAADLQDEAHRIG